MCSNCAQRPLSFVATVQPSFHVNTSGLPSTSIGSMVNTWSTRQRRTEHALRTILPP